jgi:hypothetical protein
MTLPVTLDERCLVRPHASRVRHAAKKSSPSRNSLNCCFLEEYRKVGSKVT